MAAGLLGSSLIVPGALASAKNTQPSVSVVAQGLDNPRGLAFGPQGELYVAEAGRGGSAPCVKDPSGDGSSCYGATGAITRIQQGKQTRIATGLPSLAGKEGGGPTFATGPVAVSVDKQGSLFAVIGLGGNPKDRAKLGDAGPNFGQLVKIDPSGTWRNVADISAHEGTHNPDGGEVDTNPYALVTTPDGHLVVDAGGNDLLKLAPDGTISTLAVFPNRQVSAPSSLKMPPGAQMPMQSVPNSITRGPDGAYYVGELTGFPFPVGSARILRVVPGKAPTIFAEGFTNIISLAFDHKGNLYVLEITKDGLRFAEQGGSMTGALIKITPDGARTTVLTDRLVTPTGLAVGIDDALYVSNYGVFNGKGEVLRIQP
jgi:sugar lactone lactonase YvrE